MAALRNYQYETSPRKIEPEYSPNRSRRNNNGLKNDNRRNVSSKQNIQKKNQTRNIALIAIMFFMVLVVSYRNSLINEEFKDIQNKKAELASIQKVNEQLEVSIESSLNLENIEKEAMEKLNLQKLDNSQKVYINLPKKDYTETATDEIEIEEEGTNIFKKIISQIFGE